MRSRASFRRQRRETIDGSRDLVHDAHNTGSMVAIQDLVEKARYASEGVQKGIIRAGLQRHLYPFEPHQKQIDAIWHLAFKKEVLKRGVPRFRQDWTRPKSWKGNDPARRGSRQRFVGIAVIYCKRSTMKLLIWHSFGHQCR
jgi:hypothetical protein